MPRPDLIVAVASALIQLVFVTSGIGGPVRVASGILFTSVWPGYALISAITEPKADPRDVLECYVLAVPSSLALTAILGLVLNSLGAGVNPVAHAIAMTLCIMAFSAMAAVRWRWAGPARRPYAVLLAGTLVAVVMVGVWARGMEPSRGDHEPYVSLFVLDENGQNDNYPVETTAGTPIRVVLGGIYEGSTPVRGLLVPSTGTAVPLELGPNREWQEEVELNLTAPGLRRVTWDLYTPGSESPRRSVELWVSVE